MHHTLQLIPSASRMSIFWLLFIFTLVVMVTINYIGRPLVTPSAPYGIVSFELAGTTRQAQAILDSWDTQARLHASFSLGYDYLFMGLYSTTIALACVWGSQVLRSSRRRGAALGIALGWGLWLAAALDGLENIALGLILFSGPADPWPLIAQVCAILKFTLIFLGLIYAFFALILRFWQRPVDSAGGRARRK
jgi:hypothetical protein